MASSSSNKAITVSENWEEELKKWLDPVNEQMKYEIKWAKDQMMVYYDKKGDLYREEGVFQARIDKRQEWIDNAKEEIKKKEKWIADTKQKIKIKEQKKWDAGCDKWQVTLKQEKLDETYEGVSEFLEEARERYPSYFKDEGY